MITGQRLLFLQTQIFTQSCQAGSGCHHLSLCCFLLRQTENTEALLVNIRSEADGRHQDACCILCFIILSFWQPAEWEAGPSRRKPRSHFPPQTLNKTPSPLGVIHSNHGIIFLPTCLDYWGRLVSICRAAGSMENDDEWRKERKLALNIRRQSS